MKSSTVSLRLPGLPSARLSAKAKLILAAIKYVYDHSAIAETFTNENHNGNGLYEVVREWAAMKQMRV